MKPFQPPKDPQEHQREPVEDTPAFAIASLGVGLSVIYWLSTGDLRVLWLVPVFAILMWKERPRG